MGAHPRRDASRVEEVVQLDREDNLVAEKKKPKSVRTVADALRDQDRYTVASNILVVYAERSIAEMHDIINAMTGILGDIEED